MFALWDGWSLDWRVAFFVPSLELRHIVCRVRERSCWLWRGRAGRRADGLNIKYSRQNIIPGSAQYCSIFHSNFFNNSPSSCVPHAARIICVLQSLWVCWQGNNDGNSKCIIPVSLRGAGDTITHVRYEDLRMTRVLGTILSNYIIHGWFCSGSAAALVHYNATGLLKWFLKVRNNLSIYGLNKWQHIFVIKHGIICAMCQPWL